MSLFFLGERLPCRLRRVKNRFFFLPFVSVSRSPCNDAFPAVHPGFVVLSPSSPVRHTRQSLARGHLQGSSFHASLQGMRTPKLVSLRVASHANATKLETPFGSRNPPLFRLFIGGIPSVFSGSPFLVFGRSLHHAGLTLSLDFQNCFLASLAGRSTLTRAFRSTHPHETVRCDILDEITEIQIFSFLAPSPLFLIFERFVAPRLA